MPDNVSLTVTTYGGTSGSSDTTETYAVVGLGEPQEVEETEIAFGDFTDGGAADGTYALSTAVPATSQLIGIQVTIDTAFSGDASTTGITMSIGDGTTADKFGAVADLTAAADTVYLTNAASVADTLLVDATTLTLTVTEAGNGDFGKVDAGELTVKFFYQPL